jgi:hypothetical protein
MGDVVKVARNDDTSETGHASSSQMFAKMSIKCTVTVIRDYGDSALNEITEITDYGDTARRRPSSFEGTSTRCTWLGTRHQARTATSVARQTLAEQIAIERMVGIGKEGASTTVAAMGDVVMVASNDDTSDTGHASSFQMSAKMSIKCTVTVIAVIAARLGVAPVASPPPQNPCSSSWRAQAVCGFSGPRACAAPL